jgi:ABC-type glycerol-3-phosphate transport system substrate-binding protein
MKPNEVNARLSRRRFLGAAGSSVLGVAVLGSGCTNDSGPTGAPSATGTGATANVEGEISWAIRDYFAGQAEELIAAYQEFRPAARVNLEILPTDEATYLQRISTANLGDNLPDVIATATNFVDIFASNGVTADLAPLFGPDGFSDDYFVGNLFESYRVKSGPSEGEIHGLPQSADAVITAYNTAHFEEAGIPAPADNWTWDDFLSAAQELTIEENGTTVQYGAYCDWNAQTLYAPMAACFGGKVIEDDGSRFLLDSEPMLETWHLLIDPVRDGTFASLQTVQASGFGDIFNSGVASMQFTVRAAVPAMRDTVGTFDVQMFPGINGENKTGAGAVGLAMTPGAREAVALDFIQWFFSENGGMEVLAASYGTVPPIPSLKNSDIWRELPPPPSNNEAFVRAFEDGVLAPSIPADATNALAEAIRQAGEQVLLEDRTIEEAFAEANEKANAAL